MLRRTLLVLAAATIGTCAWAADKPNFTGTWALDPAHSDFGPMPKPEKFIRKIEHADPSLKITTTISGPQGEASNATSYTTDGKETTNTVRGIAVKSTVHWEGSDLVVQSKLDTPNGPVTQEEHWTLAADGKTMTTVTKMNTPNGELALKLALVKQ